MHTDEGTMSGTVDLDFQKYRKYCGETAVFFQNPVFGQKAYPGPCGPGYTYKKDPLLK